MEEITRIKTKTPSPYQITAILTRRLDVELFLVFANKTEADIIFREEWERDVREHPNFHCYHVLEQPPAGWAMGVGSRPWKIPSAPPAIPRSP